jgi:hypothetical protein
MSVITGNPPPDDGGEGGGLVAKSGPKVLSVTIEYPDDWSVDQVTDHQKHFYKKLARAAAE